MNNKLAGTAVALVLIAVICVFGAMALIFILQAMGLVRFRDTKRFVISSVALGLIAMLVIYFLRTR